MATTAAARAGEIVAGPVVVEDHTAAVNATTDAAVASVTIGWVKTPETSARMMMTIGMAAAGTPSTHSFNSYLYFLTIYLKFDSFYPLVDAVGTRKSHSRSIIRLRRGTLGVPRVTDGGTKASGHPQISVESKEGKHNPVGNCPSF
jgi:hypothetical protein